MINEMVQQPSQRSGVDDARMEVREGVEFTRLDDGAVLLKVTVWPKGPHRLIRLDQDTWASLIATMSYYGEENFGYYRALNFHAGTPIHPTNPIIEKPPKW